MSNNENNMVMTVTGNTLTITVDLSRNLGPSATGKTQIIATSRGNKPIDGFPGVEIGLNIYKKK